MFDKATYWKNRKQGKRGQGEKEIVFYPKGKSISYSPPIYDDSGQEKYYPNAMGSHMIRVGSKIDYVNRVQARQFEHSKNRMASHKNYNYQYEKNGFRHIRKQES